MSRPFFRPDAGGITVTLKVQPKASRDAIQGAVETPDGWALKVAVTAPPDKGKANAAIEQVIAKALGLPKSAVSVEKGETQRIKTVRISADASIGAAIQALVDARDDR